MIFSGRVTSIGEIEVEEGSGYRQRLVKFTVLEHFKGGRGSQIEVVTGQGGGDCGYGFRRGGEYLVYAFDDPRTRRLYAGICSRTQSLNNADADLRFLRGRNDPARGAGIEGEIIKLRRDRNGNTSWDGPMRDVRVALNEPGGSREARTDREGRFAIWGLPPGRYTVQAELPAPLLPAASAEAVEITREACGHVRILATPPYQPPN